MKSTFIDFLKEGRVEGVVVGSTRKQVESAWGLPPSWFGMRSRGTSLVGYQYAMTWSYYNDTVNLHFDDEDVLTYIDLLREDWRSDGSVVRSDPRIELFSPVFKVEPDLSYLTIPVVRRFLERNGFVLQEVSTEDNSYCMITDYFSCWFSPYDGKRRYFGDERECTMVDRFKERGMARKHFESL